MDEIDDTTIVDAATASKILGISRQGIAYLVKAGKLRPVEGVESRTRFFRKSEIYAYRPRG